MIRKLLLRNTFTFHSLHTHTHKCQHILSNRYVATMQKSQNEMILKQIKADASKKCASLTFKDMVEYCESYNKQLHFIGLSDFVREQLLILIASIIHDFNNLPYKVNENDKIQEIIAIYLQCYDGIKSLPKIKCLEHTNHFDKTIKEYMSLGTQIVPKLCIGLKEMGQTQQSPLYKIEECPYLTNFIDIIIKRRLAIRTLLSHYRSMNDDWGIFEQNCEIIKYINNAVADAKLISIDNYGTQQNLPSIFVSDKRKYECNNFTFVPEMIHQFTFELIKNSIRAVIDNNENSVDSIRIIVVNSKSDGQVTIKISDKGGGISRLDMNKIWYYAYTSSDGNINGKTQIELLKQVVQKQPMYGLGYGLAVLSAEIKYFGGDCKIHSVDGYGTDAYLLLPNLKMSNTDALSIH